MRVEEKDGVGVKVKEDGYAMSRLSYEEEDGGRKKGWGRERRSRRKRKEGMENGVEKEDKAINPYAAGG